ncbi:hypothetical protein CHU98_g6463 [Xylaria longipes]|nr:hypothetical protein CHU98_g6463 [Xylaria longipes]
MADPLSIASGALAVITATQKSASVIYKFIRDCKEARGDLTRVRGELSELTLILELIRDDNAAATEECLPATVQAQVQAMLSSCTTTVQQIENILAKCRGKPGPLRWTIVEKDKVTTLKGSLEAFKSGLSLALETVNLSITRAINNKTEVIQDNTFEIKRDTNEILHEIYKLRNQLPPSYPLDQERLRLEQWLDSLTHYAETIITNEEPEKLANAASFLNDIEEQESDGDAETLARRRGIPLASRKVRIESESESEGGRSDLSRTESLKTRRPAPEKHTQSKRGPKEIPYHIIASTHCSSKIVWYDYCMALDIWATLHEDFLLRVWSPHKAELLVSLPVLRKDSGDPDADLAKLSVDDYYLFFCPAKPELILVQVWHRKVEVWNWNENRRISIASDMLKFYNDCNISWVMAVPQSTLVYAYDTKGYLMVVDLDEPSISRKISLAVLVGRAQRDLQSSRDKDRVCCLDFVSGREIWILWKISTRRHDLSLGKSSPWLAELVRLHSTPLDLNHQSESVTTRYSDDAIKSARVTASYRLQRKFQSIMFAKPVDETRKLVLIATNDKVVNKGEHRPSTIYILDLDTGTHLFELPLDGRWCSFPPPYRYIFYRNPITDLTTVVRAEDGCDLGTLPPWSRYALTASGKFALLRRNNSNIEFGTTDVSSDELANSRR